MVRASNIITGLDISGSGSLANIHNFIALAPNVTTVFKFTNGCQVIGTSNNIGYSYDGIVIYGDDTYVRLDTLKIGECQNDGFRIENQGTGIRLNLFASSITDCGNLNFNILNPNSTTIGSGFTQLNNSYTVPGSKFYAYLLDTSEDDEGLNILGELHVGTPENPTESVFGEGDSYTRGMLVYSFNGAIYEDISESVKSTSSSPFTFANDNINSCIYIASNLISNKTSDFHKFLGIKMSIITSQQDGEIVAEYYNGSTWVEFNHMTSQSSGDYFRKADNLFTVAPGGYQLRFDPDVEDDWQGSNDPNFNGEDRFWLRFRIVSSPSILPVFEQFKLHSNRHEINGDGFEEDMGAARAIIGISVPWSSFQDAASKLGNQDLYLSDNSFAGMAKNRFRAVGENIGTIMTLPPWVDTSGKLLLVVAVVCNTTGTLEMKATLNNSIDGDLISTGTPGNTIGEQNVLFQI